MHKEKTAAVRQTQAILLGVRRCRVSSGVFCVPEAVFSLTSTGRRDGELPPLRLSMAEESGLEGLRQAMCESRSSEVRAATSSDVHKLRVWPR